MILLWDAFAPMFEPQLGGETALRSSQSKMANMFMADTDWVASTGNK